MILFYGSHDNEYVCCCTGPISVLVSQMDKFSSFPKIAVVEAFNENCLASCKKYLRRNTHIQSINGHLLDGLNIKQVFSIVQSECRKEHVQLMIRYIRSKESISQTSSPYSAGKLLQCFTL